MKILAPDKTPEQVKRELDAAGMTIGDWAKNNNFEPTHVYDVLNGKAKGRYGQAHKIAVKLGLKRGRVAA